MELDKLRERASYVFGDLDIPLPNKLCLIKLKDSYIKRLDATFNTPYLVATLEIRGKTPYLVWNAVKRPRQCYSTEKKCKWTPNTVDDWWYLDQVEDKLKEIKHG